MVHLKHRLHLVGQRTCGWNPSGHNGSPLADGLTCCIFHELISKKILTTTTTMTHAHTLACNSFPVIKRIRLSITAI